MQLGLKGYFRRVLDRRTRLTFNWSLLGVKYSDSDFDNVTALLSADFERAEPWGRWTVAPYLRHNWADQDVDSGGETVSKFGTKVNALGIRTSLTRRLGPRDSLSFQLGAEAQDYPVADYQNGPFYYGSASFTRRQSADLSYNLGLTLNRRLPRSDHLRYDSAAISASVTKIWSSGLRTGFGVQLGRREFEGDYIFRDYPRSDDFWGITLSLFNPKFTIRGMAPQLVCSYTRNRSNIEFFVYDVKECRVGLTRNF